MPLRPADPFDLIRWLARSQSDPRKAVAELVQNSIDAGARAIAVERRPVGREAALVVRDDGEGVLPSLDREAALRHLATHIGHSHKLRLGPVERHARMVAGRYGVGLLGFWSIGRRLELRSRVAGSRPWALRLVEDEPRADVVELAARIDEPATSTEVTVTELHEPARRALAARRLADYLAVELRGAIVASGVAIEVRERGGRGDGDARRHAVVPRRYVGERLELPSEMEVEGFPPARVELYVARGADRPAVQLYCAGSLVADAIGELRTLDLDEPPWTGRELTGLIDFAGFRVPPGTRRGVMPDAAAAAFVRALDRLRPTVEAALDRLDRERHEAADRRVVDELRRALRGIGRRLPELDLPRATVRIGDESGGSGAAGAGDDAPGGEGDVAAAPTEIDDADEEEAGVDVSAGAEAQMALLPPGPLARVTLAPARVELAPGGERRVRAVACDADGRALAPAAVELVWSVGRPFALRGEGPRPTVSAPADAAPGEESALVVRAISGAEEAFAVASLAIVARGAERDADGPLDAIPEPELVHEAGAPWRSRHDGARWQINAAHDDYVALRADARARLRYLVALFAKEVVQRTYALPDGTPLEQLIAVLAHAERNLRG